MPIDNIKKEVADVITNLGYVLKEELILQTGGFVNYVFEAKTDKGNYIIRTIKNTGEDEFILERTAYFMKEMYKTGAIQTNVIDSGRLQDGREYFIIEKIEGSCLTHEIENGNLTREEVLEILKEAVETSKKISSIKMKGYGWILKRDGKFRGLLDTEMGEVNHVFEEMEFLKSKNLVSQEFCQNIRKLIDDNKELFNCDDPRLVFPDVQFGNIIVKDKKFAGLIDFDWICSGDPIRAFTAITFFMYNDSKDMIYDVHRKYKKEIEEAMGLNKTETKKLYLHTILGNISGMRFYYRLGEKIDKEFDKCIRGQKIKIDPKAKAFVGDYLFHENSTNVLLKVIK